MMVQTPSMQPSMDMTGKRWMFYGNYGHGGAGHGAGRVVEDGVTGMSASSASSVVEDVLEFEMEDV
jgi:hypothetical protein